MAAEMVIEIVLKHMCMAILCLAAMLLMLYVGGTLEENPYAGPVTAATLILFPANSAFINRGLFRGINSAVVRYMFIIALSGIITALYAFLMLIVVVNVHLAMGGGF